MKEIYSINPTLDIPIYQQLADNICMAVKSGRIGPGEQLPTVQQMTDRLGIARGTVKRTYDELEHRGMIEKVQGRGTFICYKTENQGSRKEKAVAAIDALITNLEELGFSTEEMGIFFNLKLREYTEKGYHAKIALVECNLENLSQMSDQMRHIDDIDLYSYIFESIEENPYKLNEDFDYIITTQSHVQFLESIVPNKKKILQVALRLPGQCLSRIIKIRQEKRVGVIGYSSRFAHLLYDTCKIYTENVSLCEPIAANFNEDLKKYLKDKDVIIVPKGYEKYFGEEISKTIKLFTGEVIECHYEMDEGSLLYIEARIRRLIEKNLKNS